jgi:hypothetical protein
MHVLHVSLGNGEREPINNAVLGNLRRLTHKAHHMHVAL